MVVGLGVTVGIVCVRL